MIIVFISRLEDLFQDEGKAREAGNRTREEGDKVALPDARVGGDRA